MNLLRHLFHFLSLPFLVFLLFFSFLPSAAPSLLFGFLGQDCVTLSSTNQYDAHGVAVHNSFPWIRKIGTNALVGTNGGAVESEQFLTLLEHWNWKHELEVGKSMSPLAMAELSASLIAKQMMESEPGAVNLLIGGWCEESATFVLYRVDEIGSLKRVCYGAHGGAASQIFSILDRMNNGARLGSKEETSLKSLTVEESLDCVEHCWETIQKRSMGQLSAHYTEMLTRSMIEGGVDGDCVM